MITTILLLSIIIILNLVNLSINVLVLSVILILVTIKYKRKTKFDYLMFLLATVLAIITLFIDIPFIKSGLIGFSMFNVVMFTGVIPDEWKMTKKLKTYRSLYSILGVIFIFPHVYINLFVDQQINVFGIAAIVIMLPLFLTSFNFIKKEMNMNEWIKLQKASYVVYILLFIHLISVASWYGKIVYAVMMTLYINNKLLKEFRK